MADVFQAEPEVIDRGQIEVPTFESLKVKDLSFTYPGADRPALKNISFELHRGQTLGIVGPVGSGKSTLVQILGRLRQAPTASVFMNDIASEHIGLTSWRARWAVAPQDAFLFSNTVIDNILFGRDALDRLGDDANGGGAFDCADRVAIKEEIERLPLSFKAWLGEKGVNLSGGQKQRLTIARALAHTTPSNRPAADVIVLDDSLSAVDGSTEAKILASLKAESRTVIIVAHRLAAVAHADTILVMNAGEIEAQGRHHDLIKRSPTYRKIYALQIESQQERAVDGPSL